MTVKRSKYGVRTDEVGKANRTIDGITFASMKEAKRYSELKMLRDAGEISDLKLQPRYELAVNGERICWYVADFSYKTSHGAEVVEDCKGFKTPAYQLKKKLMLALKGIRIQEV